MCPIGFLMLGARPAERFARPMPISLPQEASLAAHPDPYRRTILACTRPILVGHAVELAAAQPPPTTTARSKPTPPLAPAPPAPASSTRRRLRQTMSRSWTQQAPTPTPAPSQPYGCLPTPRSRTSLRPDTADAATHRHRTPDSGRRPTDTWTLGWH